MAVILVVKNSTIKYYEQGTTVRMIEGDNQLLPIDVFGANGLPINLTGSEAYFHLMEFSTRNHIWTMTCIPEYPLENPYEVDYPYIVPIRLSSSETMNLAGNYIGQLEIINDRNENSCMPFQVNIIISKRASD